MISKVKALSLTDISPNGNTPGLSISLNNKVSDATQEIKTFIQSVEAISSEEKGSVINCKDFLQSLICIEKYFEKLQVDYPVAKMDICRAVRSVNSLIRLLKDWDIKLGGSKQILETSLTKISANFRLLTETHLGNYKLDARRIRVFVSYLGTLHQTFLNAAVPKAEAS